MDYNINSSNLIYGSLSAYNDDETGTIGILTWSNNNWPQMAKGYYLHGRRTLAGTPTFSRRPSPMT